MDGLAAAAAHELGTPLATIKLVSAELIDELADERVSARRAGENHRIAVVGGGAVAAWHAKQLRRPSELRAEINPNVNLDIGETIMIAQWNPDGTADVQYRGARWTAIHRAGATPSAGAHRVAEMVGNRLLVDKA